MQIRTSHSMKSKKIIVSLLLSIFLMNIAIGTTISERIGTYTENSSEEGTKQNIQDNLITSDVAGSEIYSEQISAFIAGRSTLIRQTYVTNDSNIFKNFDYNDPGFYECSLMIAASNGIEPLMDPAPVGETIFSSPNLVIDRPFFGFLYYGDSVAENKTIIERADRALNIIGETFQMELIMLNNYNMTNWYPFLGYYPDWENTIDLITTNAPQDGYWGAVDTDRLKSEEYYENYHLSTSILMLTSMEYLIDGIELSEEYFDFDLRDFSFSFTEGSSINDLIGSLFGLMGSEASGLDAIGGFDVNSFINGGSKVLATLLQYEGAPEGIEKTGNVYHFDLYKAMNYDSSINGTLEPSSKILVGLVGALLTGIDISVYSGEIVSSTPDRFELSSYLLNTIETLMYLLEQDMDLSIIENYSLKVNWENQMGVNRLVTNIYNFEEPSQDPINFLLPLLRYGGLTSIPTGILDPTESITVDYAINNSEPSISIQKELTINSIDTGDYSLNITLTNKGNVSAWGRDIFGEEFDLTELITIPAILELFVETIHPGTDPKEYFGLDKNPRFFLVDTFGAGIYDTTIPKIFDLNNLLGVENMEDLANLDTAELMMTFGDSGLFDLINFEALSIYSPALVDDIIMFGLFGANEDDREFYTELYANPNSIMNPDNWEIEPGESYSYTIDDLSLLPFYNFTDFYTFNVTYNEGLEPYLIYGTESSENTAENIKDSDDSYWEIESELVGELNSIETILSFKNNTEIDFDEREINRLIFQIEYESEIDFDKSHLVIEFYNHSIGSFGDFQEIPTNDYALTNESISFSAYTDFNDYFEDSQDYASLFRLTISNETQFQIAIDCINITISDRELTLIEQSESYLSYTSENGEQYYVTGSNDYYIMTDHGPVIETVASLDHSNSIPGDENRYHLNIKNNGDVSAQNVTIQVPIFGVVKDLGNFASISEDHIYYSQISLAPDGEIDLWFDFYTPNSLFIPNAIVKYDHPEDLDEENKDFTVYSNDLYLVAPVDYDWNGNTPFVYEIDIKYETNYTYAAEKYGAAPDVGDHIKIDLTLKNLGTVVIDEFSLTLPQYLEGFDCLNDSDTYTFNNLMKGFPQKVSFIINKTEIGAIFYPSINNISGTQESAIRFKHCAPLILGYGELELSKDWSDYDGVKDSFIIVTINLTNTGNIAYQNITVNDVLGFPKAGFSLVEGVLDKVITQIKPGESYIYTYKLRCNDQGTYTIRPASVKYSYLTIQQAESNTLTIKVRNHWIINGLWILIPGVAMIACTALLYWWKNRYDLEAAIFERREELMFGNDYRSVSWDKFIIDEHLDALERGEEIQTEREKEEVY